MQYSDTPLAAMAKATLERILPRALITRHSAGERICTPDQLSEFAFLILTGCCQETSSAPDESPRVLKSFGRGESIQNGVGGGPETAAIRFVAAEESSVLRISHKDLAALLTELEAENGNGSPAIVGAVSRAATSAPDAPKGRLLTLAFLSASASAEPTAELLARALHDETGESVALVCLSACRSAGGEPKPEVLLGQPAWQHDLFKNGNGFNLLHLGVPVESIKDGAIEELTEVLRERFSYVLITCNAGELPDPALREFITRSDQGWLFLQRSPDELARVELLRRDLSSRLNGHTQDQLKTVLCLAHGELVGDFDERLASAELPIHACLHGGPGDSGRFQQDIRRMARDISGRLVGVALASGGAKGYAHIGVLQVLEENGIEVDMVAGSSMGAYVGSIWAHGADGPEMERLAREMEGRWAIWGLLDIAIPPRRGFLRGVAVKRRLMQTIGESHFADLLRPMRVVAANLETLERVVFSTGRVADAVHASIAVPGICVPVVVGEDAFADGGIVDPLPVDVLREAGVSRIIAVNTIATPERIRRARGVQRTNGGENRPRVRENSGRIMPFDQHLNYFARGNILEILMRSFLGVQTRMAETACLRASVVLCPDIADNRWVDFRNPDKYIRAGRNSALQHLDEIKALVRGKGVTHETESINESLVAVG
jgi:NTE family protein